MGGPGEPLTQVGGIKEAFWKKWSTNSDLKDEQVTQVERGGGNAISESERGEWVKTETRACMVYLKNWKMIGCLECSSEATMKSRQELLMPAQ